MKLRRRRMRALLVLALVMALALSACGRKIPAKPTPAPQPTAEGTPQPAAEETPPPDAGQSEGAEPEASPAEPEPSPEPTPAPLSPEFLSALDDVRNLIDDHRCYEAFQALLALEESYTEPNEREACEEVFSRLDLLLDDLEPATGREILRTFTVQGGCVLEVKAFSGPVLVTVTSTADPALGVSMYVRQGELGETHLPAGTYRVRYQVGYRWFGDEIGFGEYCTTGELEQPLEFDFYMDGQWASNAKYTITL